MTWVFPSVGPDVYKRQLEGLLFNPQRYDLARVGRYKVNKKLGLTTEEEVAVLTDEDIIATLRYLLSLAAGEPGFKVDDIDHFGNRRIRTVGELVANQFRIGMSLSLIHISGDEVIIPTPAFGLYESIVVANHAKAVFLDTEPAQFQIDEEALRACEMCIRDSLYPGLQLNGRWQDFWQLS